MYSFYDCFNVIYISSLEYTYKNIDYNLRITRILNILNLTIMFDIPIRRLIL